MSYHKNTLFWLITLIIWGGNNIHDYKCPLGIILNCHFLALLYSPQIPGGESPQVTTRTHCVVMIPVVITGI